MLAEVRAVQNYLRLISTRQAKEPVAKYKLSFSPGFSLGISARIKIFEPF
jgi:hypothetical protein